MFGYFYFGFIDFKFKGKSLLDCTYFFFLNKYEKKNNNNNKLFSITKKIQLKKIYGVICGKYGKLKNPKTSYIFEKTLVLSIIWSKYENEDEKIIKEEESIEMLKILGLMKNR